jgi:hypothetical protein
MAGTSFLLGTWGHDLPLLAPMGGGWPLAEILGHLAEKPKGQLRFVDSALFKVHQAGQGVIAGSMNQAIGLTKGERNPKLTTPADERRKRRDSPLIYRSMRSKNSNETTTDTSR